MKPIVIAALAVLLLLVSGTRSEATVMSWGFSGVVNRVDNPSNALPANIVVGMPFSGFVTYDSAQASTDSSPSPNSSSFYFTSNSQFQITVHFAGTTLTTTNREPGLNFAGLGVHNNIADRYDEFWLFAAGGGLLVNGGPLAVQATQGGIDINFQDNTKTAVESDAYPNYIPGFPRFEQGSLSISAYSPGAEQTVFYIDADITATSPLPKVVLTSTPLAANQLRLSWPVSATGLTLQYSTSLSSPDWKTEPAAVVDTATEHTVTVSTVGEPKFFRLVKLP